jgi:hypothetical protein
MGSGVCASVGVVFAIVGTGVISTGSGVVGLVMTIFCSYGDLVVIGWLSVQIIADPGVRSGDFA